MFVCGVCVGRGRVLCACVQAVCEYKPCVTGVLCVWCVWVWRGYARLCGVCVCM